MSNQKTRTHLFNKILAVSINDLLIFFRQQMDAPVIEGLGFRDEECSDEIFNIRKCGKTLLGKGMLHTAEQMKVGGFNHWGVGKLW